MGCDARFIGGRWTEVIQTLETESSDRLGKICATPRGVPAFLELVLAKELVPLPEDRCEYPSEEFAGEHWKLRREKPEPLA